LGYGVPCFILGHAEVYVGAGELVGVELERWNQLARPALETDEN
jgi:hypothetical protein